MEQMKESTKERIKTIVFYENETRKALYIEAQRIQAHLKDFIGKQILKVDYSLLKKINDLIGNENSVQINAYKPEHNPRLRIWINTTGYNICLKSSLSYHDGNGHQIYLDEYKYIGKIETCNLKEFITAEQPELLDAETQINLYIQAEQIKEQLEKIESQINAKVKRYWEYS